MSKYTIKTFTGEYTIVIKGSHFIEIPTKIKLELLFHNGTIDADSKSKLLSTIKTINADLKNAKKLIDPHWYDDKGKVEYLEKEFDTNAQPDDKGRTTASHTFPITSNEGLQEFLAYLEILSVENKNTLNKAPKLFTPSLDAKRQDTLRLILLQPAEKLQDAQESGIIARGCELLSYCFRP